MGITRRIYNLARANLQAILGPDNDGPSGGADFDGGGAEERPLIDQYSDDELEAELRTRRDRRRRQAEAQAATAAAERAARTRAVQQAAEAARRRAASGAGARPGPTPGKNPATGRANGAGSARPTGAPFPGAEAARPADPEAARVAALYARLETPVGADLPTVKQNFRRLLRKHHPDLAGGSPERDRSATARTADLNVAYAELERLLTRGDK